MRDAGRLVGRTRPGSTLSPAGAGGVGGTRLPLDRARSARLLGFGAVIAHTRDAMWPADGLVDAARGGGQPGADVSKLAEDLEIFASPAFGYVTWTRAVPGERADAAEAQPVRAGGAAGRGRRPDRAADRASCAVVKTPSARTDNWLYAYGEVPRALDLAPAGHPPDVRGGARRCTSTPGG